MNHYWILQCCERVFTPPLNLMNLLYSFFKMKLEGRQVLIVCMHTSTQLSSYVRCCLIKKSIEFCKEITLDEPGNSSRNEKWAYSNVVHSRGGLINPTLPQVVTHPSLNHTTTKTWAITGQTSNNYWHDTKLYKWEVTVEWPILTWQEFPH